MASGSRVYATRMLANSVSPPSGGTSRPESSEACAGTRLKELSVCHIWLPALKRLRRSPRRIRRSSPWTFARLEISGRYFACETTVRMVVTSGPKRRLNAICASSSSVWPRKSSTECSSNAAAMRRKTSASTRVTSTPTISTPRSGCSGLVSSAVIS